MKILGLILLVCIIQQYDFKKSKKQSEPKLDVEDFISPYPTNFWTEHAPKFVNNRPLIGVVAMEVLGQKMLVNVPWSWDKDYFGSSFVKLVEGAGARAVPIKEDITVAELDKLLRKINGVILPGGDADVGDSGYERISKQSIAFSKKLAKKNQTFPVLGICRGAQMMMMAEAGKDFLEDTDSLNLSLPLTFTKEAPESRMFGHAPKGLLKRLKTDAITFNAHAAGIPTLNYYNNSALKKTFRAISTNFDRNGTEFVSTFEGRHAPLYGLQWHPEKALYVFNPTLAVDHSIYGIIAAQYIANYFVSEARKNNHRFRDRNEEEENLVMRHYPNYVGNITETPYEQIYLFDFVKPFQNEKFVKQKQNGDDDEKK